MNLKKLKKMIEDSYSEVFATHRMDTFEIMACLDEYAESSGLTLNYDKIYEETQDIFADTYNLKFISSDYGLGFYEDNGLLDDIRKIQDIPTRDLFVGLIEDIEADPDKYFNDLNWEEPEPDWDSMPGGHDNY